MKTLDEIRAIAQTWEGPKSICYCGHSGDGTPSQHSDQVRNRSLVGGHGPCMEIGCRCNQFTWKKWTPEFEEASR